MGRKFLICCILLQILLPFAANALHKFNAKKLSVKRIRLYTNNAVTVLTVAERVVVDGNDVNLFLYRNGSERITVDMENGTIHSTSTPEVKVLNGTVLNGGVQIARGNFPHEFTLKGGNDTQLTIRPNSGTAVLEFSSSDELVLFTPRRHSTQSEREDLGEGEEEIWEKVKIRPQALGFTVKNAYGSLDFTNGENVHIDSRTQGILRASPFGHKFGYMKEGGNTFEVDLVDDCGHGRHINWRNETFWIRAVEHDLGIVRPDGRALSLSGARYLNTSDGTLEIDLSTETVTLKNATRNDSSSPSSGCDKWTTWTSPTATVTHGKECGASKMRWEATAAGVGSFRFDPASFGTFLIEGEPNEFVEYSKNIGGSQLQSLRGFAMLFCNRRMEISQSGYMDRPNARPEIVMDGARGTFLTRALPGRLEIGGGKATITALSATISITPFYVSP